MGAPVRKRRNPEGEAQRAIVSTLRMVLPKGSIVHHAANELPGGRTMKTQQAIRKALGAWPGFPDLVVIAEGRLMLMEVKSATGRLSEAQEAFRDLMLGQGVPWALVRSVDDALGALRDHGFKLNIRGGA